MIHTGILLWDLYAIELPKPYVDAADQNPLLQTQGLCACAACLWQTQLHEILEGPLGFEKREHKSGRYARESNSKINSLPGRYVLCSFPSWISLCQLEKLGTLQRPPSAKQTALNHIRSTLRIQLIKHAMQTFEVCVIYRRIFLEYSIIVISYTQRLNEVLKQLLIMKYYFFPFTC